MNAHFIQTRQVVHKLQRILIVDDCSISRETVRKGVHRCRDLRYLDMNLCSDGKSALEILRNQPIDIAFVDIHMPGIDGPELVAAMRETASKDCLVIAMSATLNQSAEDILREYGAYHFMQKPFRSSDVEEVFQTFIVMTQTYPLLLIDDSATMRRLARKVLEKCRFSFDIHEADGAQSAIDVLRQFRPQIVLTDFHMPNIDGVELAGVIHSASEKIAIYMMSTTMNSHLERSAAFVGVNGFLKKPFGPDDVDSIMHEYLGLNTPKFGKTRKMFSFLDRRAA